MKMAYNPNAPYAPNFPSAGGYPPSSNQDTGYGGYAPPPGMVRNVKVQNNEISSSVISLKME